MAGKDFVEIEGFAGSAEGELAAEAFGLISDLLLARNDQHSVLDFPLDAVKTVALEILDCLGLFQWLFGALQAV